MHEHKRIEDVAPLLKVLGMTHAAATAFITRDSDLLHRASIEYARMTRAKAVLAYSRMGIMLRDKPQHREQHGKQHQYDPKTA